MSSREQDEAPKTPLVMSKVVERPRIFQSDSLDQWASELSTCLRDGKCREGMRSVTGEEFSPLVGQLVSHYEDGSLGGKGGVGREKKYSHANAVLGILKFGEIFRI
ncbi:hypothetical protein TNCV_226191 [Trichonephila clavipes]|nr:hypothetical protein TNCV_226191 [Trichonephila clavipes]